MKGFKISLAGDLGSGKSTVIGMIRKMGYPVFSADEISRTIYADPRIQEKIERHFPECISEKGIDRAKLSGIVFSDKDRLEMLNSITHPAIMENLFLEMEKSTSVLVFAEVPLLFEEGYERRFDQVIVVLRDRESRIASVQVRDGLSKEEVVARIKNQFDYEKNKIIAHTLIYNDGDLNALYQKVERAINEIKKKI